MTLYVFVGGAGCGKTYRLMETLTSYLTESPLGDGCNILALTFMHGSRRRLNDRLRDIPGLNGKYECSTIDSFAWRVVRRWQALAIRLDLEIPLTTNYDSVCEIAGTLLQYENVARWVASTFPALVLDEAQDLTPVRLRVIQALSCQLEVFAAADEYQCLNENLRPNPACKWLTRMAEVESLDEPKRTDVLPLLEASSAIRAGEAPVSIKPFLIVLTPNIPLAGTYVSNNIGWYGQNRSIAIITPTAGQFAKGVIDWVQSNRSSKGCGPYEIQWEQSESNVLTEMLSQLVLDEETSISDARAAVKACGSEYVFSAVERWLDVQRRACGRTEVTRAEIENVIKRSVSARRRMDIENARGRKAMTVHGAKNREFDNVIVLWPAASAGSDDHKRRLLYNAVTRAKSRCLVLVQAKSSLENAPFT